MDKKISPLGILLIATFFILLAYASWLSAKSIDWDVLKRVENSPLTLPTIAPSPISTNSATPKK